MSSQIFDDISKALEALGYRVTQATITQDPHYRYAYNLSIDAVGPFAQAAVQAGAGLKFPSATPTATQPVCECGAAAAKTTHSSWCPLTAAAKP
jgi:hypothetical protein